MTQAAEIDRDRRDLRRGAWQILSGFGVRTVARILLIIFVARLYGVSDFGRLGETVAIVELAAALAIFGLNKTMLGRLANTGSHKEAATILEALTIAACVAFLLVCALWFLWPQFSDQAAGSTRIALLGIPLIALAEIALTATRHHRTVAWDTITKAIVKPWSFLLFALVGYVWAGSGPSPAQMLIIAYVASLGAATLTAAVALFMTGGYRMASALRYFSLTDTYCFARSSFPIAVNETAVFAFRRADIILLALVAGPTATGIYYLAQQIGTLVEKIRYLFEPMLAPIIAQSRSIETIGSHLRRLCLGVFATQLAIVALIAILGQPLLAWLNAGFAAGLIVVMVVLIGEVFDGSFGLCELPMVYRHPQWPPRLVLVALALEVGAVWLLASQLGALGAAMGFAAAMGLLAIGRISLVRRLYGIGVLNRRFGIALLTALVASVPVALTFLAPGSYAILASIAASVSFLILYGGGIWLFLRRQISNAATANAV